MVNGVRMEIKNLVITKKYDVKIVKKIVLSVSIKNIKHE